jgi:UrcA family protein
MSSKLFLAALATSAMAATPALADTSQDQAPSVRVTYGDLDLSSEHGAHVLLSRLNNAARNVCGGGALAVSRNLSERAAFNACREQALGEAVASAHQPLVTELYDQQHGAAHAVLAAR